jgi:probable F420-dependent oxidoreductase
VAHQRPGESPERAKYAGDLFDPFVSAGYLASLTERVRIGFGIIVVPYRHPVVTAKMLSTLDQLSEGRVIAGVGPGYVQGEFDALGIPRRGTGSAVDDLVDLLREVERTDRPDFTGRRFRFADAFFRPAPFQPHLPVWVGGNSDAAVARAVRCGDGWQPSATDLEAMRGHVRRLRAAAHEAGRSLDGFTMSGRIRVRLASTVRRHDTTVGPAQYQDLPPHIEGPPEHLVEELLRYEELGVDHLVLNFHEGDELPDLLRALDVLGERVLPHLEGRFAA